MVRFVHRTSVVVIALLLAAATAATAQSGVTLDKHARKVQHKLTHYRTGSYLHLVLKNGPDAYGALGSLSDASFTFTNAETNAPVTYRYQDVARIRTNQEPIGEGSEPHHHIRHLVPIVITAAAAGAGAAVYEAVR